MRKLFIITVLLISSLAHSQITIRLGLGEQEADGIIFKKNNEKISGEVDFPKFNAKKVKIKIDKKNHQKIASADIDSIQLFDSNKKQVYTFVWTKTKVYKSKGTEFKVVDEGWICLIKKGKVSVYLGGQEYGIKKDSMRVVEAASNHYLKKKDEDYPVLVSVFAVGGGIGYNVFFREYGQYYFKDNAVIAEKIKNKEYKSDDMLKVVEYYNSYITPKATTTKSELTKSNKVKSTSNSASKSNSAPKKKK